MSHFRNILVGVDPLRAEELSASNFKAQAACAVQEAIHIAAKGASRLTFLSIIDVPEADMYLLEPDRRLVVEHLEQSAQRTLGELVQLAATQGITAEAQLGHGQSSSEIVRWVERGGHDLVIVARSGYDFAWRDLLGHTALKLIHHCPAPVWVAKPQTDHEEFNVLVASDLSDVGRQALRTGLALRSQLGGQIHVLHVLESPLAGILGTGLFPATAERLFKHAHADAQQALADEIAKIDDAPPEREIDIQVIVGRRDPVVLEFVQEHKINLLVMGTSARSGMARFVLGNTAERLLPYVHCSLLAVKTGEAK